MLSQKVINPSSMKASAKETLFFESLADHAHSDVGDIRRRLHSLNAVIPGFMERMYSVKRDVLVELAFNRDLVVYKMLVLSECFPSADISSVCCKRPDILVTMDEPSIREASQTLHEILGNHVSSAQSIDWLVEQEPMYLFTHAVSEAVRTYTRVVGSDLSFLERDPKQILTWQSRVGA
jgi:hypothetical protein